MISLSEWGAVKYKGMRLKMIIGVGLPLTLFLHGGRSYCEGTQ